MRKNQGIVPLIQFETTPQLPRRREYAEVGSPELRKRIAHEIKSAREFHDLTLEQVHSITKINIYYLQNIEEGRFNFLPPVYVKLFIKAVALIVGIQKEDFNRQLDELFATARMSPHPEMVNTEGRAHGLGGTGLSEPSWLGWIDRHRGILLYSAASAVLLLIIGYYLLRSPKMTVTDPAVSSPTPALFQDTTSRMSDTIRSAAPVTPTVQNVSVQPNPAQKETFKPVFFAADTCYIRIEDRDGAIYDRTLWPGNRLTETFPSPIKVVLGNAPAMVIILNGDTLPRFSAERKVRTFWLNPNGIGN